MTKKPLRSPSKVPNPTLRTQCLTNLLDNKRKRILGKDERGRAAKKHQGSSATSSLSFLSQRSLITPAQKSERRSVDVFGNVKSGSLSLLCLSSKNGTTRKPLLAATLGTSHNSSQGENPTGKATINVEESLSGKTESASSSDPADSAGPQVKMIPAPKPKLLARKTVASKAVPYTAPKIRPPPPSSYSVAKGLTRTQIDKVENCADKLSTKVDASSHNKTSVQGVPSVFQTSMVSSTKRPKRDLARLLPPSQDLNSLEDHRPLDLPLIPSVSNTNTDPIILSKPTTQETSQPRRISALETMPLLPEAATKKSSTKPPKPKENFIRLNLRNNNGACRGARKSSKYKSKSSKYTSNKSDETTTVASARHVTVEGVDPVDDFIDGTFSQVDKKRQTLHLCKGHQEPCKLLKVKKTGPNKGRQFYVCPCPRSEQCDHFQWADDTQQAAQVALRKNKSTSGFIARQVAAYMKNIDVFTIPELKDLAKRHGLNDKGKKGQLRTRISIWVRDEIARGMNDQEQPSQEATANEEDSLCRSEPLVEPDYDDEDSVVSRSTSSSSSDADEGELELIGLKEDRWNRSCTCDDGHSDKDFLENDHPCGDQLESKLRSLFGHTKFRPGQEWAIRRSITGHRSLLVAPTGSGKSLCYALPAAMKSGITIVVSPLISLIEDQLRVLPPSLPAATLSGSMTKATTASILDDVLRGRIKLLFVSPERLVSASFRRLFRKFRSNDTGEQERLFPTVSLFCVDEAHCLSQWAHNFRPCYLRLGTVLQSIEPESVLAITATAEPRVVDDICARMRIIRSEESVRLLKSNRDNIDVECLFMGSQEERLSKLIKILQKKSPSNESSGKSDALDGSLATGSVIVYVWRQMDAQIVAENILARGITGGVAVYHGGMDSGARVKAQSKFMRGKCRICVATIAFGLGINKSDVAGVIHMHLSSSPEHYIQEIGRAGRGGQQALAIALVLQDEVLVRHSMAHSDLLSFSQCNKILRLLQSRIGEATAKLPVGRSHTDPVTVSFPLSQGVNGCDCKPETIETIVSLFEEREGAAVLLHVEGALFDCAVIAPKQEPLDTLAESEEVLAAVLACSSCTESPLGHGTASEEWPGNQFGASRERSRVSGNRFGVYSFSVSECANCVGADAEPRHVFAALRRLQNKGVIEFDLKTNPHHRHLQVRMTSNGMVAFGADSIENLVKEAFERFSATVLSTCKKVLDLHAILEQVSKSYLSPPTELGGKSKGLELFQKLTTLYLDGTEPVGETSECPFRTPPKMAEIARDAQLALQHLSQVQLSSAAYPGALQFGDLATCDYTCLGIAKFLHGLSLPSISPTLLRHHPVFGRWQDVQFNVVLDMVKTLFARRDEHS